jgi:hypothetical protein
VLHLYYHFLLCNFYKIDILDPIDETYRNDNLLYYPEAYQRLQETVRSDPELTLLDSNTHFTINVLPTEKSLSMCYPLKKTHVIFQWAIH